MKSEQAAISSESFGDPPMHGTSCCASRATSAEMRVRALSTAIKIGASEFQGPSDSVTSLPYYDSFPEPCPALNPRGQKTRIPLLDSDAPLRSSYISLLLIL